VLVGHSCVLSWWRAVHGAPAPAAWNRYKLEVECALRSVDLVIAPSRAMLQSLEANYGALPRVRVIQNARGASRFRPGPKWDIVLSAGRLWDEAKNVASLAQIAGRLSWPVYVAGDGVRADGAAVDLGSCCPLGRLSSNDLARWMAGASIYALPARYEPFGLSALEAALSGCALVLGDIPSLREVWGDAARFVPPGDTEALAATLERLIVNAAARRELARRGLLRAQEFTPAFMAERYLSAYGEALNRHRSLVQGFACAS
jgi:glycogen synthase